MGEGNLLKKVPLPRTPTLLKLLGGKLGAYEGERLKSECSCSLHFPTIPSPKVLGERGLGEGAKNSEEAENCKGKYKGSGCNMHAVAPPCVV